MVEDETPIANFIRDGLREEGFAVDVADNGRTGLELALGYLEEYDLFLLDWMLPGVSGIEICRRIRNENKLVPVIFLTAKDTVDDAVFGLEAGANDYIRKPFAFEELLAFDNHTVIFKFYLHISYDQQEKELKERIKERDKNWKHNPNDWKEREQWDKYMRYYEYAINNSGIPWTIVPVDERWYRNYIVEKTIVTELEKLNMEYPPLPGE